MPIQPTKWILMFLLLGGCQSDDTSTEPPTEFEQAKRLWETSAIESYTITQRISCFCIESYTRPRQIQVRNGSITQVDGAAYDPEQDSHLFTVQAFFAFVEESLLRNPHSFTFAFDPTYGFPTETYFDFEEMIADDEIGYYFSAFEIN